MSTQKISRSPLSKKDQAEVDYHVKKDLKKIKPVRMQYLRSKTQFSNRGVILERKKWDDGKESVIICHIPYSGMDSKTAERLGNWLLKQSKLLKESGRESVKRNNKSGG